MKHFDRIATGIDTSEIRAVLDRWPEIWTSGPDSVPPHIGRDVRPWSATANTTPDCDWLTIYLRWLVFTPIPDQYGCDPRIDNIAHWARRTVRTASLLAGFSSREREIGRILLTKLAAGGRVPPHIDSDQGFSRFHLVITSDPRCLFTVEDESVHMAPGELWRFDHLRTHSVANDGPDRIHLILDAVVRAHRIYSVTRAAELAGNTE